MAGAGQRGGDVGGGGSKHPDADSRERDRVAGFSYDMLRAGQHFLVRGEVLVGDRRILLQRAVIDERADVNAIGELRNAADVVAIVGTVADGKRSFLAMVHHGNGPLSTECDCPEGRTGVSCEHAAAVGLCYVDGW